MPERSRDCTPLDAGVGAFAVAAGEGVGQERGVEDRFDDLHDGVVHDPVTERGRADAALLRLVDGEVAVRLGLPGAVGELAVQGGDAGFEVFPEHEVAVGVRFAPSGVAVGALEVVRVDDAFEQVPVLAAHAAPASSQGRGLGVSGFPYSPLWPTPAMCLPKQV